MNKTVKYLMYFVFVIVAIVAAIPLIEVLSLKTFTIPPISSKVTFPKESGQFALNNRHNEVFGSGNLKVKETLPGFKNIYTGVSVANGFGYFGDSTGVVKFSLTTGKVVWKMQANNEVMTEPLVEKGMVFVGSGNMIFSPKVTASWNKGKNLIRGTGKNSIYGLSVTTGKVIWQYNTPGENMPTFVYSNGVVYVASGSDMVYALDSFTGKLLWSLHIPSFVSMSSPILYKNLLIFGGDVPHYVYAVNINTHKIQWRKRIYNDWGGTSDESIAEYKGIIYTINVNRANSKGVYSQTIYALSATTGNTIWSYFEGLGTLPVNFSTGIPTISKGIIYAGSPVTNYMYALNYKNGALLWKSKVSGSIKSCPTIYNGIVYVGDELGNIYAFSALSGNLLSVYNVGGVIGAVPLTIIDNNLIIGTINNGKLEMIPLSSILKANLGYMYIYYLKKEF